ncbi:MAG: phycobiliprotein lyase [Merismopedia sp. SIO2A8]|nr:phycobiliprotein lyase [Merismopedia sp. SIO2A8]
MAAEQVLDDVARHYFIQTEGDWRSQRRYYTLKSGAVQEVESSLGIRFLDQGASELQQLAMMHELSDRCQMTSGIHMTWESNYVGPSPRKLTGETVFGVWQNILYRDRGFSTSKPIAAMFTMPTPSIMCLKTEYGGSRFDEEIKLIGQNYRTRQTIISRANEEQMIGQYLETRIA